MEYGIHTLQLCLSLLYIYIHIINSQTTELTHSTILYHTLLPHKHTGATFMAAGSSAPELFTSVSDAFFAKNSIGIGTIVGSAMFNILVIVAMSAAVVPNAVKVDWKPIVRDAVFYAVSIGLLVLFILNGGETTCADGVTEGCGEIVAVEGLIMVLCYGLYILFMVFNKRIFAWCDRTCAKGNKSKVYAGGIADGGHRRSTSSRDALDTTAQILEKMEEKEKSENTEASETPSAGAEAEKCETDGAEGDEGANGDAPLVEKSEGGEGGGEEEEEEEEGDIFEPITEWPDSFGERVWFLVSFGFNFAFIFTIPNCSRKAWESWYLVTFVNSILWIGALCLVMVAFGSRTGCLLGISPPVMGIVLLAAGTSVPDAIASIIVARNGQVRYCFPLFSFMPCS